MTVLTRKKVTEMNAELNTLLAEFAAKHGLKHKPARVRFNDDEFKTKVELVSSANAITVGGVSLSKAEIDHINRCGLLIGVDNLAGKEFTTRGEKYAVVDFKTRSHKYPIVAVSLKTGKKIQVLRSCALI